MAVTAKVVCSNKVTSGEGDTRSTTLHFQPDYADGRNQAWAQATPHLQLDMTVKGAVEEQFEAGKPYTLTFEPTID